jgi:hypothetical protein
MMRVKVGGDDEVMMVMSSRVATTALSQSSLLCSVSPWNGIPSSDSTPSR